ncbi:hypothetical protein PMI11_05256 [Rhizobium sp. CF142]|nr:hypothetical protein PMI11_05256 [Rhizobium sp. CF142]
MVESISPIQIDVSHTEGKQKAPANMTARRVIATPDIRDTAVGVRMISLEHFSSFGFEAASLTAAKPTTAILAVPDFGPQSESLRTLVQ